MPTSISTQFVFETSEPTDVLLQFEAADILGQQLLARQTELSHRQSYNRIAADDGIGDRLWLNVDGRCEVNYNAQVELSRLAHAIDGLDQVPVHTLPADVVKYLFDSRYCQTDQMQNFVNDEFGDLRGGARIDAMQKWIGTHFSYMPGASDSSTTALDSLTKRQGVCRDYAHVLVALARASAIPARFVSCYGPRVFPQDFHAVAEVFLCDPNSSDIASKNGAWHLIDATNMASAEDTIKIGVGRDAADVSFMTSFGASDFLGIDVSVGATT